MMERPNKEDYIPFNLTGDTAIAKWMIDYSDALEKYIDAQEQVKNIAYDVMQQSELLTDFMEMIESGGMIKFDKAKLLHDFKIRQ